MSLYKKTYKCKKNYISRYAESPGEGLLRLHDECVEGKTRELISHIPKLKVKYLLATLLVL